jgi:hypothetical protein
MIGMMQRRSRITAYAAPFMEIPWPAKFWNTKRLRSGKTVGLP